MKFSADDLRKVADLYKRKIQIGNWKKEIDDKIYVLERQKLKADEELSAVLELLGGDYKELAEAAAEFADATKPSESGKPKVEIYNTGYVTNGDKEKLLKAILEDYQAENPEATHMSYQQVKAVLESRYNIQTRTIGNFFNRQLREYDTTGGNKKKLIVLK